MDFNWTPAVKDFEKIVTIMWVAAFYSLGFLCGCWVPWLVWLLQRCCPDHIKLLQYESNQLSWIVSQHNGLCPYGTTLTQSGQQGSNTNLLACAWMCLCLEKESTSLVIVVTLNSRLSLDWTTKKWWTSDNCTPAVREKEGKNTDRRRRAESQWIVG